MVTSKYDKYTLLAMEYSKLPYEVLITISLKVNKFGYPTEEAIIAQEVLKHKGLITVEVPTPKKAI